MISRASRTGAPCSAWLITPHLRHPHGLVMPAALILDQGDLPQVQQALEPGVCAVVKGHHLCMAYDRMN